MKNKKKLVAIILLLIVYLISWQIYEFVNKKDDASPDSDINVEDAKEDSTSEYPDIGGIAPDFELEDVNGDNISLKSFRGKPLLLVFWTTECPYCIQELQFLKENYDTIKETFMIVTVNVTAGEESALFVKEYVEEENFPFTVLLDKKAEVYRKYLVRGIPITFIIDSSGKIVEKKLGAFGPGYLDQFKNIE